MLENLQPPKRNFSCKVGKILTDLNDSDRKVLENALSTDKSIWPAKTLSNELAKRGLHIVDTTITKHRTKQCWCFRDR